MATDTPAVRLPASGRNTQLSCVEELCLGGPPVTGISTGGSGVGVGVASSCMSGGSSMSTVISLPVQTNSVSIVMPNGAPPITNPNNRVVGGPFVHAGGASEPSCSGQRNVCVVDSEAGPAGIGRLRHVTPSADINTRRAAIVTGSPSRTNRIVISEVETGVGVAVGVGVGVDSCPEAAVKPSTAAVAISVRGSTLRPSGIVDEPPVRPL
jgi:hypothetical protein